MMETDDYLKFKKWDHTIVSIIFASAYFLYVFAFDLLPFMIVVTLLGFIFIAWAILETGGREPLISRLIPKYHELVEYERSIAPEAHHNYRSSLRMSLWIVGIALIVIAVLDYIEAVDVDEQAISLPVIFPLALIIVNFNVHSRYKRMLNERKQL